jgi:hypothetical protein
MTHRQSHPPGDPSGINQPHDVLAAEEFPMPGRAAGDIPPDPIHEPHDVLAAEEFPMPTGGGVGTDSGIEPRSLVPGLLVFAVLALILLRKRG